ncbi:MULTISPECIES: exodeoxyribonuclease V subunit gamma [Prochlorococcus]|uniref:Exodeoxyribonuclease V gamma chain n=1 Tax=Prochlorococcus marinus str. MIT 9116 TaxID=167544 RepID=A0A0A1ZRK5_PROMR|nr:exodeoxyribonuclease V subunit gamma [Prochlorococcus marinus]KGF90595.1 Exodeoxyribonuclease V gamma chain [Prochlorococcus marinus str. MIT 9107]KGF90818.1 Exodeoxyribonuclease V gamma chain [Prochlorococcus marinus str. MIT 9116]KGF93620.1 Exodeoxyribonuclease V gamma chain [Prochlorococcus marinus str. MIT 9123]
MLNLYKSNKIEVISELLAEELKICPPFINENLEIAVPNYFLGKWLSEQITIKNKISALYELKTISSYTESLLTNFFPEIDMGLWNFESIKWGIIDSLEELNSFKESFPLRNWINKYLDNKKTIDGDLYNLTKKITSNFIDYLIFRPEMISEWNRYEINSLNLYKNLNKDQFWQPILYKLLEKKISEKPSCLYMIELIKNLREIKKFHIKIPNQIYIISDNNLSKLYINFYSELSKFTKVNLYLLSAGDDLWNRINCIEGELEFENFESKFNFNTNIEKIFGKFGANFQKLIEENIYKEGINLKNNLIYIDPITNFYEKKDTPLLNQIQKRIIDNNRNDFIVNESDDSILLCEHFNQNSQLEYIRNKIIEIINSCENINYSDIAVLSPQTNQIKPYLRYIFNNEIINGIKIPYIFIDENNNDSSDIYKFLIDITGIANEKITIERIDFILSKKETQNILDFDVTEKDEIILLLSQVGFHWGLDSNERLGEEKNSLEWCINRIILGLIYDKEINLSTFNLKPFSPKNISLDLNKWVKILINLKKYINLLRGSFSYLVWVEKIKFILKKIADCNTKYNLEISEINRILDSYAIPLIPDDPILLNVFIEILISCINKAKYQSKSRINKILVSDIENARHIPHKVIFLIDMNSIYYPKLSKNENINLLNNKYHLGDPSVFDREKYLFLELLIACRDKFIVNWVKNDKNNKKLDVSFPIKELISFFDSFLKQDQRKLIIKDSDLNKKEIIDLNSSKIIKSNYSLVENIDWNEKKSDTKNYKLSELIYWFKTPQKYWLNKRNISPKEIFIHHPDDEYVSNLQKSQLITKIIQELEIDNHNFIDDLNNLNINDKLVENGIFMPKNSFFIKEKEIKDLIGSLSTSLSQHNKINRIYVKLNANKEEYFIADDTVIELIHSKLSLSRLTEAWIKSLFISSLNKNIKKTKLIFRIENHYKSQIIQPPGAIESNLILEEYINIFKNYSEKCLPLPPESTYKYVEAKIKSKNEKKAFTDRWIGNKTFSKGEKDNIEMKLCFGNEKEPDFFFGNNNFDKLSFRLYGPLIEALKK